MKISKIEECFSKHVGPVLLERGFVRSSSPLYERKSGDGLDRVAIDVARESRAAVMISYIPAFAIDVHDMLLNPGADVGFPVGPYLTPAGVFRGPRFWSFKDQAFAERSAREIVAALTAHGFAWLERLREPSFFASQIFPSALLMVGLAKERLGDPAGAREAYREMLRRYVVTLDRYGSFGEPSAGRLFVFFASKLGEELVRRDAVANAIGFHPNIAPILD